MPEDVHLVAAAAQQSEFRLHDVTSTLTGFWSPGCLQTILVAGYHMHFLSEDRKSGGHLLGLSRPICAARTLRSSPAGRLTRSFWPVSSIGLPVAG
jgi:hypothetical protein